MTELHLQWVSSAHFITGLFEEYAVEPWSNVPVARFADCASLFVRLAEPEPMALSGLLTRIDRAEAAGTRQ